MGRHGGRLIAFLTAASALATASSCVEQTATGYLQLLAVVAPPNGGSVGGTCTYPTTSTTSGPFLTFGTLDVAFADQYEPVLLLASEHFRLTVHGANVRITDLGGSELTSFSGAGDLLLDPLVDGGRGLYPTTLVDTSTGDALRQQLGAVMGATKGVVSYVTVSGTTSDGQTIDSNEVGIPVYVCYGCLVTFPFGSSDPKQPQPNCLVPAASNTFQPCAFGQDQPIDCQLCQSNPACVP